MTESHASTKADPLRIHSITLSENNDQFVAACDEGCRVYATKPLQLLHIYERPVGSSKVLVARHFKDTPSILMVTQRPNQAYLYNYQTQVLEQAFETERSIMNVQFNSTKMIFVCENRVEFYHVAGPRPCPIAGGSNLYQKMPSLETDGSNPYQKMPPNHNPYRKMPPLATGANAQGLCATAEHVCVVPASKPGTAKIVKFNREKPLLYQTVELAAHKGMLQAICLSADGLTLATASTTGTLIRIWNVKTSQAVCEFRRSFTSNSIIFDIAISKDKKLVACVSSRGTVHVFCLNDHKLNEVTVLPLGGGVCMKSMVQYHIEDMENIKCKLAFLDNNNLLALLHDGRYFELKLKPRQKTLHLVKYVLFVDRSIRKVELLFGEPIKNNSDGESEDEDEDVAFNEFFRTTTMDREEFRRYCKKQTHTCWGCKKKGDHKKCTSST